MLRLILVVCILVLGIGGIASNKVPNAVMAGALLNAYVLSYIFDELRSILKELRKLNQR